MKAIIHLAGIWVLLVALMCASAEPAMPATSNRADVAHIQTTR